MNVDPNEKKINWGELDEEEQKEDKEEKKSDLKINAQSFVPSIQIEENTNIKEEEPINIFQSNPEKNKINQLESVNDFSQLGLSPLLLKGVIIEKKFNQPSPIQQYALPMMIGTEKNKAINFIGQAKAGSGKTAAFVLGLLSHIDSQNKVPQGLIVCPSRELAVQVYDEVKKLAKYLIEEEKLGTFLAVADDNNKSGNRDRQKPINDQVIVGTPGKVADLIKNRIIDARNIKVLVLDEADMVLSNMEDQIKRIRGDIMKETKKKNIDLLIFLFSATFPERVRVFANQFVNKPFKHLYLRQSELNVEGILQYKVDCSKSDNKKFEIIQQVFRSITSTKLIVFFNTKIELDKTEEKLKKNGFEDIFIVHANLEKKQREENMLKFRDAPKGILMTTNLLARGIDIEGVTVVINYDLPISNDRMKDNNSKVEDLETYYHRIGRTGRYGYSGIAVNLLGDRDDFRIMKSIEIKLGKEVKVNTLEESELSERLEEDEKIVEEKNEKRKEGLLGGSIN
eukprot:TRINITY_DN896_c0_g2_i1.p2 TRINITY_DN896_c0_g2~~TRINITY_DN896_c0_g2_i1.p2  ORF type:complete len:511 (-),score=194.52 TRINITY_DN896_c0_g2_i1:13-1545(-)